MLTNVTVIIVTYRSADLIERCLAPLLVEPGVRIIVWENASGDRTRDIVEKLSPQVKLVVSEKNLGFGEANNQAARLAETEFILFLNPDAFLPDVKVIASMVAWLRLHPEYAVCGPKLLNSDESHQVGDAGWAISFFSVAAHFLLIHKIFSRAHSVYLTNRRLLRFEKVDVDWICGACLLVRRSVFEELGGFSSRFFMYGEDIDLGTRIRGHGWKIAFLPSIEVMHLQGASQKSDGGLFYSTKWIDDILFHISKRHNKSVLYITRTVMAVGFLIRALVSSAYFLSTGARKNIVYSRLYLKYMVYMFRS